MTAKELCPSAATVVDLQARVPLEPEKFADLVAVVGDPIAEITELERISVRDEGRPSVRNDIASH